MDRKDRGNRRKAKRTTITRRNLKGKVETVPGQTTRRTGGTGRSKGEIAGGTGKSKGERRRRRKRPRQRPRRRRRRHHERQHRGNSRRTRTRRNMGRARRKCLGKDKGQDKDQRGQERKGRRTEEAAGARTERTQGDRQTRRTREEDTEQDSCLGRMPAHIETTTRPDDQLLARHCPEDADDPTSPTNTHTFEGRWHRDFFPGGRGRDRQGKME
eukprot:5748676-Prorocentrum_lima.AAC.1